MRFSNIIFTICISALVTGTLTYLFNKHPFSGQKNSLQETVGSPSAYVNYKGNNESGNHDHSDFSDIAAEALPAVVQVRATIKEQTIQPYDPFAEGGPSSSLALSGGSGVIIKDDGYIITNEHVIRGALEVMVTLNNKKAFKATVVGTDRSSDLAVLKIDGSDLPHISFANSDEVKVGQWVLAIGYPLNLESTVTAGIVSGKARKIGINQGDYPEESFIQTDAVINVGNSGGALLNTEGELVGITSSLISPNGTYVGYSYAIPSNLVKSVAYNLIKTGKVQRA